MFVLCTIWNSEPRTLAANSSRAAAVWTHFLSILQQLLWNVLFELAPVYVCAILTKPSVIVAQQCYHPSDPQKSDQKLASEGKSHQCKIVIITNVLTQKQGQALALDPGWVVDIYCVASPCTNSRSRTYTERGPQYFILVTSWTSLVSSNHDLLPGPCSIQFAFEVRLVTADLLAATIIIRSKSCNSLFVLSAAAAVGRAQGSTDDAIFWPRIVCDNHFSYLDRRFLKRKLDFHFHLFFLKPAHDPTDHCADAACLPGLTKI